MKYWILLICWWPGSEIGGDPKPGPGQAEPEVGSEVGIEGAGSTRNSAGPPVKAAPPEPKLPSRVKLPAGGQHLARELFPILELLSGQIVVADRLRVEEVSVVIPPEMGRAPVTREEFLILLGAHGIFLFPSRDGDEQPFLVASTNPHWTPRHSRPPSYTRRFQIRSNNFNEVASEVQDYLDKKNQTAPPGVLLAGAALDPRTRLIIVRAPSQRTLAGVDEIIHRFKTRQVNAPHLYSYTPKYLPARVLREKLLNQLSEVEARKISLVALTRGNVLLIRASEDLHQKVLVHLRNSDVSTR